VLNSINSVRSAGTLQRSLPTLSTPASTSGWRPRRLPRSASPTLRRRSSETLSTWISPRCVGALAHPMAGCRLSGMPYTFAGGRRVREGGGIRRCGECEGTCTLRHRWRSVWGGSIATGADAVAAAQSSNDIYAPCSGVITAVNEALEDEPELLNSAAHGDGWIAEFKVRTARHTMEHARCCILCVG
jgi:hypothetical protein